MSPYCITMPQWVKMSSNHARLWKLFGRWLIIKSKIFESISLWCHLPQGQYCISLGGCYKQRSTEIRAWISTNYKFHMGKAWMSNYIPLFYMDVITYLCPKCLAASWVHTKVILLQCNNSNEAASPWQKNIRTKVTSTFNMLAKKIYIIISCSRILHK